jgi:two-component sensor histidine kinase
MFNFLPIRFRMRHSFTYFFVICFVQLVFPFAKGQTLSSQILDFKGEQLSVKDGLSQGLIAGMLQDKDGVMWLGTKDGLNKYDGYRFTVYRHEQGNPFSIPGNYVTHIAEDANGNLWIGTFYNGLCLFDRAAEKFYPVKLSKSSDSNQGIYKMMYTNGRLTVQTTLIASYDVSHIHPANYNNIDLSDKVIVFNSSKFFSPHRWNDYSQGHPGQIMPDGSIWVSYSDSVLVFAIKSKQYVPVKSFSTALLGNDNKDYYRYYTLPQRNRLLCINDKYLAVYDTATHTVVKRYDLSLENWIVERVAIKTRDGNYFISGGAVTLNYIFNSVTYQLQPVNGLNSRELLLDHNGILWIGTAGNGAIKNDYRKQLFTTVKDYLHAAPHNNKGEIVRMINKQPHFVNLYTKSTYPIMPSNVWNPLWAYPDYVMDRQGIHWAKYNIEDNLHLIRYNPTNGIIKKRDLQFTSNGNGEYLITDHLDNLWLQAENISNQPWLIKIEKNTLQKKAVYKFPLTNKIVNGVRFLSSYWQDAYGVFWFATVNGLFRFDEAKNKWNHYQHNPANVSTLSTNMLFSICPDPKHPDKYLWLGTDGMGLTRFEIGTGHCIHFSEKEGLPNSVVYGILTDNAGNLWLSTNKGLCVLAPPEAGSNQTLPLKIKGLFTADDGLPGNEFNRYEYYKLPNGDLFFGGTEGGVVFNPQKVLTQDTPPPIILTGLTVYNKPVSHKTDSNIISQHITYAKSITLPYDKNMFSISFAALEYRASAKKQYKYYLEGYDDTWIASGSKNEATYTNLPPGTYTFHAKGKGSMSSWTVNDASIKVIILPAYWQTLWFRTLMAMAVATAVYGLYRYRLRKAIELEKVRNRIAADLHDEIGSTLSSISISSAIIQKKLNGKVADVDELLYSIDNNTSNMMEAMSDIVWTINTKNDSFENVINRMRAFAFEMLQPKNCEVHFEVGKGLEKLKLNMIQRKNFYLIFKEAINNAAKYADCKSVWINLSIKSNHIINMKIKDDGKGFDTAIILQGAAGDNEFGGNGLINMQKRATEMKASFTIASVPTTGTEVNLEFAG